MKQTAVDYLIKEFSDILGEIKTSPIQDLFMVDAMTRAKELFEQQMADAFHVGFETGYNDEISPSYLTAEKYYQNTFKK